MHLRELHFLSYSDVRNSYFIPTTRGMKAFSRACCLQSYAAYLLEKSSCMISYGSALASCRVWWTTAEK